jgi:hypothetical protein
MQIYKHASRIENRSSFTLKSDGKVSLEVLSNDDDDDDDDVYLKKSTTRVSQNLILHKNADQPKA